MARKCVRFKTVRGVRRCAKFSGTKSRKKPSGGRSRRRKPGPGERSSATFWLDRDWCKGKRTGFPKGYSAKGLKCTRRIPGRGGRWPSTTPSQMRSRAARARRVRW